MPAFRDLLIQFEEHYDRLKYRLSRRLDPDQIIIQPYIGYGTPDQLHIHGRVMESTGIKPDPQTLWQNIRNTYHRFASDEIPHAVVRATYGQHSVEVEADKEGFFRADLALDTPLPDHETRVEIGLELVSIPGQESVPPAPTTGEAIIPARDAQFGVISDLDDTVIQTDVLNLLKLARNTFLRNAQSRLPFEGVAAFYRALQHGTQNTHNPIYYLSNSPWNLYDMLRDFFALQGIPLGAFFLQDLGLKQNQFFRDRHHKHNTIRELLHQQAHLPFILIGDSGEHDPEIYHQVTLEMPERIAAIYIRDVTRDPERSAEIHALAESVRQHGVDILLIPDTQAAIQHATAHGFIT